MTRRSVINNKQEAIGETLRQFAQEHIHALAVHGGQYKITGIAVEGADGTVDIRIFTDDLRRDVRPASGGSPTILRLIDASETGFVLKENLELLA